MTFNQTLIGGLFAECGEAGGQKAHGCVGGATTMPKKKVDVSRWVASCLKNVLVFYRSVRTDGILWYEFIPASDVFYIRSVRCRTDTH